MRHAVETVPTTARVPTDVVRIREREDAERRPVAPPAGTVGRS